VIALIRGEAIKLRSTRTAIGFTIAGVIVVVLLVLATTLGGDPSTVEGKREALSIGGLVSIVLVVFGIVGATGEYRHRTVAPAILIAPDRTRVLLARAFAYAVTAVGVAIVMAVVSFAIGLPLLAGKEGPALALSDCLELLGGGMLAAGLGALIGVGIGALIGNQVGAVVGFLVYFFIGEFTAAPLISDEVFKFTILRGETRIGGVAGDPSFDYLGSLGVVVGWAVILMLLGVLRERSREVT